MEHTDTVKPCKEFSDQHTSIKKTSNSIHVLNGDHSFYIFYRLKFYDSVRTPKKSWHCLDDKVVYKMQKTMVLNVLWIGGWPVQ